MNQKKQNRKKTLAAKFTVRMLVALLVVFVLLISFVSAMVRNDLKARELKTLELLARENASVAASFMTTMLNKQEAVVAAVLQAQELEPEKRARYVADILDAVGAAEQNILSLFFVAEPNAFLPETPKGFSVFATQGGVSVQNDRFGFVEQSGYEKGLAAEGLTILDPFAKTIDGTQYKVLSVLLPVKQGSRTIGVLGCNIDTQVLANAAYDNGGYETFNNEIICGHQTLIMNSRSQEDVGQNYAQVASSNNPERILQAAAQAKLITQLETHKDGTQSYRAYVPFYVGSSTTPWLSGTSISRQEFDASIIAQVMSMVAASAVAMLVLCVVCFLITRRLLRPMTQLENAILEMEKGNLQAHTDESGNDELGRVGKSLNAATQTIYGYVKDIDRAMGEMARGNFDVYPSKPFIGDFSGFETSITNFIRKICNALNQIKQATRAVAAGADQLSASAMVLSQGATEQAGSVEELTSTIAELEQRVFQNNESAKQASAAVQEAGDQLVVCGARMREMTDAMEEITTNSSQIGKIIKDIEDIAFQTNILALNAAVEAARAGAAGKGFAVVADEVRTLAGRSAEAAKSTTDMINSTIQSVKNGSRIAVDAASSVQIVQEKAGAVVSVVDEIQTASQEQFDQIKLIGSSAQEISGVIQTNSATAQETSASSEELAGQGQLLRELTGQFTLNKLLTENFENDGDD